MIVKETCLLLVLKQEGHNQTIGISYVVHRQDMETDIINQVVTSRSGKRRSLFELFTLQLDGL